MRRKSGTATAVVPRDVGDLMDTAVTRIQALLIESPVFAAVQRLVKGFRDDRLDFLCARAGTSSCVIARPEDQKKMAIHQSLVGSRRVCVPTLPGALIGSVVHQQQHICKSFQPCGRFGDSFDTLSNLGEMSHTCEESPSTQQGSDMPGLRGYCGTVQLTRWLAETDS